MTQCFPKAPNQLTTLRMKVFCVWAMNLSKDIELESDECEEN